MTHRIAHRLRYFEHDPSGPHAVRPIIDHVIVTSANAGFTQIAVNVTLSPVSIAGFVGDQFQMTATAYDSRGGVISNPTVAWSVDDSTIASVSSTGLVILQRIGSATITATVDGRAYTTTATAFGPSQLVAQLEALGANGAGATNWTVYQKGVNQTISGGFCSRWGDAINNAHPFLPSAGFASGAAVAGDGTIIGEGLEVADCSLGKTIIDDDTDITSAGTEIPGTNLITTLGSRHDVGMLWGGGMKLWEFVNQCMIGELADPNLLQAGLTDRNSQTALFEGAGAGADWDNAATPNGTTGGSPFTMAAIWAARTTGGALAGQPLICQAVSRDIDFDVFKDTNTNTNDANGITAPNRRWRIMVNAGIAAGPASAASLLFNACGRWNAAQRKLINDYIVLLEGAGNCWTDPRPNSFTLFGDSWQPTIKATQLGENGSPLFPNTACMSFARSGNDLKRWQFPMAHYLADRDYSARTGRVAIMWGEYLNGGTPTDNGYGVGFIKAISPKIHVVVYNITHTGSNSAANDPAYQNAIDAAWQTVWGADALIDFRNMPLWYSTYHYGDGTSTFPPGEKAIIYDGVSQHPSALGQEYMTAFYRAGAYAATGQDDSAVPMHIDPTDGLGTLQPSLNLSAGTPTGSVTWLVKNRAGATLGGRTLTFSSLDPSIATVDAVTGVVTRVSAGRARIKAVTDLGGVGVLGVEAA